MSFDSLRIAFQGILIVTEAEANIILNIILDIVPDVLDALDVLVQKKAIFSELYLPVPLIHGELVTLEGSVLALGDAMIPLAPVCNQSLENVQFLKLSKI